MESNLSNKLSKEDGKIINIIQLLDFTSTYKQILRLYINYQQKPINQSQANISRKVILIGYIGSGKTTIFNKCCKQNQESFFGGICCTRNPYLAKSAYGKGFILIDTPGLGNDIDRMTHVCGIQKALSEGDTHQILVCVKFERINLMGRVIRDIIIQKLKRFRDTITVVITYFDLALTYEDKLKSIEEQNEILQLRKDEISQRFKKYNVDSVLFTKEDESGQIICSQLDQILEKNSNGRKCMLQKSELLSYFELIDELDDLGYKLLDAKRKVSTMFQKIATATKTFINQFDQNLKFLVDIMHALSLAIKEKALEILEQYEKDNIRDFEELYEDQQEEVIYYIHAQLKAELIDVVQSVQFAAQQKISRFYQYPDLIKQCPYCGLIWIKVDSCQGSTYCGEYSEKDNDQMFLQSQQSGRFQFNFSVKGVTYIIENPQITQMINKNKQKKPQDQLQLIGCGKKFNWQEIRPLDEDKMRELYDIGILDYLAVVNPKYSKSQQILSDKIDRALKGVQIINL